MRHIYIDRLVAVKLSEHYKMEKREDGELRKAGWNQCRPASSMRPLTSHPGVSKPEPAWIDIEFPSPFARDRTTCWSNVLVPDSMSLDYGLPSRGWYSV